MIAIAGYGIAVILGLLLFRSLKAQGKLKAQNDALMVQNDRLRAQIATGKPSDDAVTDRLRKDSDF